MVLSVNFLLIFIVFSSNFVDCFLTGKRSLLIHPLTTASNGQLESFRHESSALHVEDEHTTHVQYSGEPIKEGAFLLDEDCSIEEVTCEHSGAASPEGEFQERLRIRLRDGAAYPNWRTGSLLFGKSTSDKSWKGCFEAENAAGFMAASQNSRQHHSESDELADMLSGGGAFGSSVSDAAPGTPAPADVDADLSSTYFYRSVGSIRVSPLDARVLLVQTVQRDWYHMFESADFSIRHVPHRNLTEDHLDALRTGADLPSLDPASSSMVMSAEHLQKRGKWPKELSLEEKFGGSKIKINYRDLNGEPINKNEVLREANAPGGSTVHCVECHAVMSGEIRIDAKIDRRFWFIPVLERLKVVYRGELTVGWSHDSKVRTTSRPQGLKSLPKRLDQMTIKSEPVQSLFPLHVGGFDVPLLPFQVRWSADLVYRLLLEVNLMPHSALLGAEFTKTVVFGFEYRTHWPKGHRIRTFYDVSEVNRQDSLGHATAPKIHWSSSDEAASRAADQSGQLADAATLNYMAEVGVRLSIFFFKSHTKVVEFRVLPRLELEMFPFRTTAVRTCIGPEDSGSPNHSWANYFSVGWQLVLGGGKLRFFGFGIKLPTFYIPSDGNVIKMMDRRLIGYSCVNRDAVCQIGGVIGAFGDNAFTRAVERDQSSADCLAQDLPLPSLLSDGSGSNGGDEQVCSVPASAVDKCHACISQSDCGFCPSSASGLDGLCASAEERPDSTNPYLRELIPVAGAPAQCTAVDFLTSDCSRLSLQSPADSRVLTGFTTSRARYLPESFCQEHQPANCPTRLSKCLDLYREAKDPNVPLCNCFDDAFSCFRETCGEDRDIGSACKQCLLGTCSAAFESDDGDDNDNNPERVCGDVCPPSTFGCPREERCAPGCSLGQDGATCVFDMLSREDLHRELEMANQPAVQSTLEPALLSSWRNIQRDAARGTWVASELTVQASFRQRGAGQPAPRFRFGVRPVRLVSIGGDVVLDDPSRPPKPDALRVYFLDQPDNDYLNCWGEGTDERTCVADELRTRPENSGKERQAFRIVLQPGHKLRIHLSELEKANDARLLATWGYASLPDSFDEAMEILGSPSSTVDVALTDVGGTAFMDVFRRSSPQANTLTVRNTRCQGTDASYALAVDSDTVDLNIGLYSDKSRGRIRLEFHLTVDDQACDRRPETDGVEPWIFGLGLPKGIVTVDAARNQISSSIASDDVSGIVAAPNPGHPDTMTMTLGWQLHPSMPEGRYEVMVLAADSDYLFASSQFHIGVAPSEWSEIGWRSDEPLRGAEREGEVFDLAWRVSHSCSKSCGGGELIARLTCTNGDSFLESDSLKCVGQSAPEKPVIPCNVEECDSAVISVQSRVAGTTAAGQFSRKLSALVTSSDENSSPSLLFTGIRQSLGCQDEVSVPALSARGQLDEWDWSSLLSGLTDSKSHLEASALVVRQGGAVAFSEPFFISQWQGKEWFVEVEGNAALATGGAPEVWFYGRESIPQEGPLQLETGATMLVSSTNPIFPRSIVMSRGSDEWTRAVFKPVSGSADEVAVTIWNVGSGPDSADSDFYKGWSQLERQESYLPESLEDDAISAAGPFYVVPCREISGAWHCWAHAPSIDSEFVRTLYGTQSFDCLNERLGLDEDNDGFLFKEGQLASSDDDADAGFFPGLNGGQSFALLIGILGCVVFGLLLAVVLAALFIKRRGARQAHTDRHHARSIGRSESTIALRSVSTAHRRSRSGTSTRRSRAGTAKRHSGQFSPDNSIRVAQKRDSLQQVRAPAPSFL